MSNWHYSEQIGRTQVEDREASRRLVGAPRNESSVKFVITEETLVSLKSLYLFTLSACYWGLKFLPLELSSLELWIVSYFNAITFRSGNPRNCCKPSTIEHWFNEEFLSTQSQVRWWSFLTTWEGTYAQILAVLHPMAWHYPNRFTWVLVSVSFLVKLGIISMSAIQHLFFVVL